ncbi:alpha/beta hydrolase [Phanerochaete sordida]|uniref:Alpha/beta hydrolase n=1 Tax=Phanerochaete sordida TaxID=48140 RepID=A0A9P3G983_9APHY|nr:alpha/beta hydrolase [Phanerochaete sordida]
MMVLLQRKIIYMNYVPPGAREEQLANTKVAKGISCEEVAIPGEKGITLHGVVVRRESSSPDPKTVIFYMQGNAGTPLARMPVFQRLLLGIRLTPHSTPPSDALSDTAVLAVAPRSYWKSTPRRCTERGLLCDYEHALSWACARFPNSQVVLYGHSLGGAAAVCLAARLRDGCALRNVAGLVLENPLGSVPAMVKALYPQRWLPYHHLGAFAIDRWDAVGAMVRARKDPGCLLHRLARGMLLVLSKKDEIVPNCQGMAIFDAARAGEEDAEKEGTRRVVVLNSALHENAWRDRQWRTEVEAYVRAIQERPTDEKTGSSVSVLLPY